MCVCVCVHACVCVCVCCVCVCVRVCACTYGALWLQCIVCDNNTNLSVKVQVNSLQNTHFQVKSNLSSIFGRCHLGTAERQRELQHKPVVQHTDTK